MARWISIVEFQLKHLPNTKSRLGRDAMSLSEYDTPCVHWRVPFVDCSTLRMKALRLLRKSVSTGQLHSTTSITQQESPIRPLWWSRISPKIFTLQSAQNDVWSALNWPFDLHTNWVSGLWSSVYCRLCGLRLSSSYTSMSCDLTCKE